MRTINRKHDPWFSSHSRESLSERFYGSEECILNYLKQDRFIPYYVRPNSVRTCKLIFIKELNVFITVVQDESNGGIITILDKIKLSPINSKSAHKIILGMLKGNRLTSEAPDETLVKKILAGKDAYPEFRNIGISLIIREKLMTEKGVIIKTRKREGGISTNDLLNLSKESSLENYFSDMIRFRFSRHINPNVFFVCLFLKPDKNSYPIPVFWGNI